MAWQKNGTPDTLVAPADDIDVIDLEDKKFGVVLVHMLNAGVLNPVFRVNGLSTNVYAIRSKANGGAETATINNSYALELAVTGGTAEDYFSICYQFNISVEEKLFMGWSVSENTSGAANAPGRREGVGKWADTSNVIEQDNVHNNGGGDFDTGSNVSVLGTD